MSLQEKFKLILATSAFDQLSAYTEPISWNSMSQDERELLGLLFVEQGEIQLKERNDKVLESFDLASKVAPKSPMIFFRKALAFAAQGQNMRCLLAANEALDKATQLDPRFVSAWHSWGNILVRAGLVTDNASYFYQADEKFSTAFELLKIEGLRQPETLFWHWAVCWYHIGKQSGEAVDFYKSLEKFSSAAESGCDNGEFHNDYGNVLIDYACLLGRQELLVEAAGHYKKFTAIAPYQYEGWLNLACTNQRLYEFSGLNGYFQEADDCFARAIELNREDSVEWLRWAELYANSGKASRDTDRIQASFEKFEKANELEPESPHVLLRWGEAQMLLASYTEDLNLLREAESKIVFALNAISDKPEAWYVYGVCLYEFGRYFGSEEYYLQAIEKFEHGLKIDPSYPLLLHGIALALFALGEMKIEVADVTEAVRYFGKVADVGGLHIPQFYSDWGVALMKLGEMTHEKAHIEAAAEKFEQAISRRLDGTYGDEIELEWLYNYGCALDFLGDFHEDSGFYERAVQVLSHVVRLDPDYAYARYNLALALYHLGELTADLESFQKAIDLFHDLVQNDPEDEVAWNDYGLALLNLAVLVNEPARVEIAKQLFEQAESKFHQAVALGNIHAFYNLACLNALSENYSAAMHYLERSEINNALPPIEDLMHDEWLENLHSYPSFRTFISRLLGKDKQEK